MKDSSRQEQNKYVFPKWARYSIAVPSIAWGTIICISAILKDYEAEGITTVVDKFKINSSVIDTVASYIDQHTEEQNRLYGGFLVALGASMFCRKSGSGSKQSSPESNSDTPQP